MARLGNGKEAPAVKGERLHFLRWVRSSLPEICDNGEQALTIRIDEKRMFEIIEHRKPRSIALNGPEALIPKLQDTADHVAETFGIEVYVIGDTCWGSCDLNTHAADMLGADILFNIGHTVAIENFGAKVVMINAYDDISFANIADKCASDLVGRFSSVSLLTDSQHLHKLSEVKSGIESRVCNAV